MKITMSRIHCVGGRHSELLFLLPVALLDRLTHHRVYLFHRVQRVHLLNKCLIQPGITSLSILFKLQL